MDITVKRVYDEPTGEDGFRVLVDRLWPRGESKEKARIDFWDKDIAPSAELRTWFNHDPNKWPEFQRLYRQELSANPDAVQKLVDAVKEQDKVTLVFGSKDAEHNQAVVLQTYLQEKL